MCNTHNKEKRREEIRRVELIIHLLGEVRRGKDREHTFACQSILQNDKELYYSQDLFWYETIHLPEDQEATDTKLKCCEKKEDTVCWNAKNNSMWNQKKEMWWSNEFE